MLYRVRGRQPSRLTSNVRYTYHGIDYLRGKIPIKYSRTEATGHSDLRVTPRIESPVNASSLRHWKWPVRQNTRPPILWLI